MGSPLPLSPPAELPSANVSAGNEAKPFSSISIFYCFLKTKQLEFQLIKFVPKKIFFSRHYLLLEFHA